MPVIYYTADGETFTGQPGLSVDEMIDRLEDDGHEVVEIGGDLGR